MKNRILHRIAAMAALIPTFATAPDARAYTGSEVFNGATWSYEVIGKYATLTAVDPLSGGSLIIPRRLGGKSLADIGEDVFRDGPMSSVEIAATVMGIGPRAFYHCSNVTNVHFSFRLATIGQSAFEQCEKLKSVALPQSLKEIGDEAFRYCRALQSVDVPSSVTSIGHDGFADCTSLRSVTLREGLKSIKSGAFARTCLNSIVLPDGLTSIDADLFEGCSRLAAVTIPDSVTAIESGAFAGCVMLPELDLPEGLVEIGPGAFRGCRSLTELRIPESVKELYWAFNDATGLKKLYMPAIWKGTPALEEAGVPEGCQVIFYPEEAEPPSPQTVWRFYSSAYKAHFFTIDEDEKDNLRANNPNWQFEGGAYRAFKEWSPGTVPLYRFYSSKYKGHFYTTDEGEKDDLIANNPNWKFEGVAFYVYSAPRAWDEWREKMQEDSEVLQRKLEEFFTGPDYNESLEPFFEAYLEVPFDVFLLNYLPDLMVAIYLDWFEDSVVGVPVYRFYSQNYRHHFYTIDEAEKYNLITGNPNWAFEGAGFYALPLEGTGSSAAPSSAVPVSAPHAASLPGKGPVSPQTCAVPSPGKRAATGGTPVSPSAPWSLAALPDGAAVTIPGETDLGGVFVETRGDAPEFADLWPHAEPSHAENAESAEDIPGSAGFQPTEPSHAENAEVVPLRLALPEGLFDAQLWSITDGLLLDEAVEGTFDFELSADGAWRWLRVRDADDADAFSLWLRAE